MNTVPTQDVTCSNEPLQTEALLSDDTGRAYRAVRREFYERLAALVDMPTRPTATQGIAWRSGRPGRYHSLIVLPYIGSFDPPGCRDGYPWTLDGRPVPRIYLNHYDWHPSKLQRRRWSLAAVEPTCPPERDHLELTVAIDELADFAPWIAGWVRASESGNPSLILPPPHPLARAATAEEMLRTSYDWTMRANAEYHRRWQACEARRRQRERRRVMAAGA